MNRPPVIGLSGRRFGIQFAEINPGFCSMPDLPLDVVSRMLGHAKTEITERRYVKYRPDLFDDYRKFM